MERRGAASQQLHLVLLFLSGHHRHSLREAGHIISRGMRNSLVNVTLILLYFLAPSCTARPQGIVFSGNPALDLYGIPSHGQDVVGDLDVGGRMYGSSQLREDAGCQGSGEGRVHALRRFAETRTMKTGTTIAGVVFEGGVVLGADTRATGGKTVCDRNCDKIHILASNIACCGAGTSADADRATEGVRIALLRMASEIQACLPSTTAHPTGHGHNGKSIITRDSTLDEVQRGCLRVSAAAYLLKRHLFRHQGTISAALVLGGVDAVGTHLYQIHEGGSMAEVDFAAMGSGSLAALSTLEGGYRRGLTEEDAKELVASAISAGITNDLGSGSNVDLCVITADRGLEHHRGVRTDLGIEGHDACDSKQGDGARTVASGVMGERVRLDGDIFTADISTAKAQGETHDRSRSEQLTNLPATAGGHGTELYGKDNEIGGEGGSRAWVGSVRRRGKKKRIVRVDLESAGLKEIQCNALDDRIEVL